MLTTTRFVRPTGAAALVIMGAAAGVLARRNLSLAVLVVAATAGLQFFLILREERKRAMPGDLLRAVLADLLDDCRERSSTSPLPAFFGLWAMNNDGVLHLLAGDRDLSLRFEAQHSRPRDPRCPLWQAYEGKAIRLQPFANLQPEGGMEVQDWDWRCGIPLFDVTDHGRVTGVLSIDGRGDDVRPEALEKAGMISLANHAVRVARPIVSALEET